MSQIVLELVLVIATGVLAWATLKLAQYTQAISKLTERLVKIETERDARDLRERRRRDLSTALDAAETLQGIHEARFIQRLTNREHFPTAEVKALEALHVLKRYLDKVDTECYQHLDFLCNTFDSVRCEKEKIRINEKEIAQRVNAAVLNSRRKVW